MRRYAGDRLRVELDLNLHVLRDRDERRAGFAQQHLARLVQRVDVRVVAVALVGQLLHRRVLEVADAEAEHGQEHAAGALLFDQPHELVLAGGADVEVAVGREDHAIDAAADEVLARDLVGEADALAAVGRSAGFELRDRAIDAAPF